MVRENQKIVENGSLRNIWASSTILDATFCYQTFRAFVQFLQVLNKIIPKENLLEIYRIQIKQYGKRVKRHTNAKQCTNK
jgi:hypothetical protein